MKDNTIKILISLFYFFSISNLLTAQSPMAFKYQAVARDASNIPYQNQNISLRTSILKQFDANPIEGDIVFMESHRTTTTDLGLVAINVGLGTNISGDFSSINWGNGAYLMRVEIDVDGGENYVLMGTSSILGTPYAFHAQTVENADDADANPQNELQTLQFDPNTNELSISNGNAVSIPIGGTDADADPSNELQSLTLNDQTLSISGSNSVDLSGLKDEVNDADANPENEIQTLSFNQSTNELSISGGNAVSIPTGGTDADADPQNELQSISKNGNTISLSINGGSITDEVNDADANPENELQVLSKNGNTISLSNNGGSITDEVKDADADAQNELQTLNFDQNTNKLSISNGNEITIPTGGTDADADPSNEIQSLVLNNQTLSISGSNSVDLSGLKDGVNDADADPSNEIQSLVLNDASLSISGSNSVDLSGVKDGVNDADADPLNEIQSLVLNDESLSISGSNSVDLSGLKDGVNDADADPSNEIQSLVLNDESLSISGSNSVDLSGLKDGVNDADADPNNEIQSISKNGSIINLSNNGGSIIDAVKDADADPQNEIQTLKFNGTTNLLTISDGNAITLPISSNADVSPTNELQTLNLSGYDLSISDGNSLCLSTLATPWTRTTEGVSYLLGTTFTDKIQTDEIQVNKMNALSVDFNSSFDAKGLKFEDKFGNADANLSSGQLSFLTGLNGSNLSAKQLLLSGAETAILEDSKLNILNTSGKSTGLTADGVAAMDLLGNKEINMTLTNGLVIENNNSFLNAGFFSIDYLNKNSGDATSIFPAEIRLYNDRNGNAANAIINSFQSAYYRDNLVSLHKGNEFVIAVNNESRAEMEVGNGGYGILNLRSANGRNVALGAFGSNDHGFVGVYDSNGTLQAGLRVNNSGQGEIFADLKNFRMAHPEKSEKEIWYASLEGPEAGAYERGTAKLKNGEIFVPFSDHFKMVGNPATLTVQLTPLSAETYGLAVVEKTAKGFKVKELAKGSGDFLFDWEVKCVRKGFEQYEVVRDRPTRVDK